MPRRPPPMQRRAGVYAMVLIVSTVVAAVALLGMELHRAQRRAAQLAVDAADARILAQSAVELGLSMIAADPNWRTNLPSGGSWVSARPMGRGAISVDARDPVDAGIANNADDPIVITGTAVVGQARQVVQVTLQSVYRPLPCITGAAHAANTVLFSGTTFTAPLPVSTNANMDTTGGGSNTINAPAEAASGISGGGFNQSKNSNASTRAVPAFTAAQYYQANGTSIPWASIPGAKIQRVVLSPSANPFGATNAQGIYVIDCGGSSLTIQDCRIVGTIVLLNPGNACQIAGSVNWQPAVPGFPALLVDGDIVVQPSNAPLSELTTLANYNPPGTPYMGSSNILTIDTYPSIIRGLIYAHGAFSTNQKPTVTGVLLTTDGMTLKGTVTINPDTTMLVNAPPGFRTGPTMVIVPGSWRQVVN